MVGLGVNERNLTGYNFSDACNPLFGLNFKIAAIYTHFFISTWPFKHMKAFFSIKHIIKHMKAFVEKNKHMIKHIRVLTCNSPLLNKHMKAFFSKKLST